MTPDQFRTAQNEVMRGPVALALVLLRDLPAAAITPEALARLVALLYPRVVTGRAQSVEIARAYYGSMSPRAVAPDVDLDEYLPAMLARTVQRFGGVTDERRTTNPVHGAAAVGRHIDQAGREYVAKASSADGVRFARYDPFGETCAFCRLLISRGPVYLSETTGAFQSHPLCTCVPVPVHDARAGWPGREQYEEADALYRAATVGTSGRESIRAFRRAVEGAGT